ncbi:MAG: CBS domain-containing protein [Planctomycetes bacterium]|nr:CBS domain-containing protein [Planctomycetota bacterium]
MRVRDLMTSPVFTIEPDAPAQTARERMRGRDLHHLVVVRQGAPCGVLSARDLGGRGGATLKRRETVEERMTPLAITVTSNTTVRQAASLMRGRGIGCLPVVDSERLIGIVTISDLLGLLAAGLGVSTTTERRLRAQRLRQKKVAQRRVAMHA